MEIPTDNSSINMAETENKLETEPESKPDPELVREIPSGVDLFYALHNSTQIEEILKKDQLPMDGLTDCQKT